MNSFYEDLLLRIEEQPSRLGVARLKKILNHVQSDKPITEEFLIEVLKFDYTKKTESFQEVYKILSGMVVDDFVKNNGQEAFLSVVEELGKEPDQEQEQVAPISAENEVVAPQPIPTEPKQEPVVPEQVNQEPAPRKKVKKVVMPTQKPVQMPEHPKAPEGSQIPSEAATTNEIPYVAPQTMPVLEEEVPQTPDLNITKSPEHEETGDKKNSLLKYLAVGIPTVVLIAGLAVWQVTAQKQASKTAETQAAQILKELPKEEQEGEELSNSEYEDNISVLTRGIDTIKQNDKTGLSGYLIYEDKKYIIQKYDKTGSLVVFDVKGEKTTFDPDWVDNLIKRTKAGESANTTAPSEPSSEAKAEGASL